MARGLSFLLLYAGLFWIAGRWDWVGGWAYVAAMLFLALHMKHTVRAVFQTLGFSRENYFGFFEFLSWMVTLMVVGGFISIPLSVQLGWLALP